MLHSNWTLNATGHVAEHNELSRRIPNARDFGAKGDGKTDDTAAILAAQAAGINDLNAGTYLVTSAIGPVSGAGSDRTILKIGANLNAPLFNIVGGQARKNRILFSSFSVWNPARTFTGDIFGVSDTSWLMLDDIYIYGAVGSALHLTGVWDSEIRRTQFAACGDATHPVVLMDATDEADYNTGCNNVTFLNLQTEGSYGIGAELKKQVAANRFIGCKWHGVLPNAEPYYSVFLNGALRNIFLGCNFTHGGATHISIDRGGLGNVLSSSLISSSVDFGIDIVDGSYNLIAPNIFGADGVNVRGNYRVQSGDGNVFSAENVQIALG